MATSLVAVGVGEVVGDEEDAEVVVEVLRLLPVRPPHTKLPQSPRPLLLPPLPLRQLVDLVSPLVSITLILYQVCVHVHTQRELRSRSLGHREKAKLWNIIYENPDGKR